MHSPRPRKLISLPDSINRQLNMYALAASAAGVGMLALAQAAEAKIVYTPAHKHVIFRMGYGIFLDVNHDGKKDVSIAGFQTGYSAFLQASGCGPGNSIWTFRTNIYGWNHCDVALPKGKRVGTNGNFNQLAGGGLLFFVSTTGGFPPICSWVGLKKPAYLGLKLGINGETHYGWARLSVQSPGHGIPKAKAIVTGYAYETIPNKPIITDKTEGPDVVTVQPDAVSGSLGRLAIGRK